MIATTFLTPFLMADKIIREQSQLPYLKKLVRIKQLNFKKPREPVNITGAKIKGLNTSEKKINFWLLHIAFHTFLI